MAGQTRAGPPGRVLIFGSLQAEEGGDSLALGGLLPYPAGRVQWFDQHTLTQTMTALTAEHPEPLLVAWSLQGLRAMTAMLRRRAVCLHYPEQRLQLHSLCARMDTLKAAAFDLSLAVWEGKGAGTLRELCAVNGLSTVEDSTPSVAELWQAGRVAEVVNQMQAEMQVTGAFLTFLVGSGGWLMRGAERLRVQLPQRVQHAVEVAQKMAGV